MSGRANAKAGCQRSSLQFNYPWQGQNLWALMSPTCKIQSCGHRSLPLPLPTSVAHHLPLHLTLLLHIPSFLITRLLQPQWLVLLFHLSRLVPGLGPQYLAAPSLWNAHNSLLHFDTYPSAPQRSSCLQISLSKNPNSQIEPRSAALQADSLPAELPGKPTLDSSMFERNKIIFL